MREIICNSFFPLKKITKSFLPNTSILSIGGNVGDSMRVFKNLFQKLNSNSKIKIISTSPIYKNPPFGYLNQSDFYNATIILYTSLSLIEFFSLIFYLERVMGRSRKRDFKNAPRILDIDIIFFNDVYIRNKKMNIPHLFWMERESVLIPLMYQINYKGF